MTLRELYNLKLYEYRETGLRDKPGKLLAMLILPEKDNYEALKVSEGEFYEKYQKEIDTKIAKVENDFNFTKDDIINFIEETVICDDYDRQKVWFVFCEGFGAMHWGIMYHKDSTPEDIFSQYFDDNQLKKQYNIEEQAIANNIKIAKLDDLISKIMNVPADFYCKIEESLSPEERMFIISRLTNKSCMNCTNGSCNIELSEKVGLDEFGKPQGSDCLGWNNHELVGRSKVLKISDTTKLK